MNYIEEICAECNNYFSREEQRHIGTFKIQDGNLTPSDFLKAGQYFRIVGSALNDGVYQVPTSDLVDEEFDGAVWAMNVPKAVVELAKEVETYMSGEGGKISPFISESFGGYSYTKATNSKGVLASWQDVFSSRLNKWRRIRVL